MVSVKMQSGGCMYSAVGVLVAVGIPVMVGNTHRGDGSVCVLVTVGVLVAVGVLSWQWVCLLRVLMRVVETLV